LPKFRGGSPLIWPVILGQSETGLSLFSFTPGMDEGPIWAQARIEIGENEYISQVLERVESKALEQF
jgi:methionyl-tRNA formyltransferase